MPIYSVGDEKNKEIHFGVGDIKISSGYSEGDKAVGVLALTTQSPRPIGTYQEIEEVLDIAETPVMMIFNKVESVDAFIRGLERVKKYMLSSS